MPRPPSVSLLLVAVAGAHAFAYAPATIRRGTGLPDSRVTVAPMHGLRPAVPPRGAARVGRTVFGARAVRAAADSVGNVAVILLAGGVGSRMKAGKPKQFLELEGKTILRTSLDIFLSLSGVTSISVVLAEEYRDQLADVAAADPRLKFAAPGKERQDSVLSGLQTIPDDAALVCVHDAARPLVTPEECYNVIRDANVHGAAVLAVPMKATVKESADGEFVLQTIDRSRLWEIHTPQVIKPDLLRKGFDKVAAENLAVTDDVSIIEQLPAPVKITLGEYTNIKITTPEDMPMAKSILAQRCNPVAK